VVAFKFGLELTGLLHFRKRLDCDLDCFFIDLEDFDFC